MKIYEEMTRKLPESEFYTGDRVMSHYAIKCKKIVTRQSNFIMTP